MVGDGVLCCPKELVAALKRCQDGRVIIRPLLQRRKFLYSPNYGAGWSTWNPEHAEFALFYKPIIEFIEAGGRFENDTWSVSTKAHPLHPLLLQFLNDLGDDDFYLGGASDLQVETCPDGEQFRIEEYDGSESVTYRNDARTEWH